MYLFYLITSMTTFRKFINHMLANHSFLFFGTIIIILVIIGTLCFHFIEDWDLFHSFYFTTVTMATVGYGDMAPITYAGKVVAIFYGFMGAPLFVWLTGILLQSKFHKIVKWSIHEYHKELKEASMAAKKLWEDLQKEHELQEETIREIENTEPLIKKARRKKILHIKALFKKKQ